MVFFPVIIVAVCHGHGQHSGAAALPAGKAAKCVLSIGFPRHALAAALATTFLFFRVTGNSILLAGGVGSLGRGLHYRMRRRRLDQHGVRELFSFYRHRYEEEGSNFDGQFIPGVSGISAERRTAAVADSAGMAHLPFSTVNLLCSSNPIYQHETIILLHTKFPCLFFLSSTFHSIAFFPKHFHETFWHSG